MAKKILVIDDDLELVELVSFALLRADLLPYPAFSSTQAMSLLVNESPDVILLDVRLGSESGFTLLEAMRLVSSAPVIMISGDTSQQAKLRAFELGADDYLTKPFGGRELLARVKAQLRRRPAKSEQDLLDSISKAVAGFGSTPGLAPGSGA